MHVGRCFGTIEFEIKVFVISHNTKVYTHTILRSFVDFLRLHQHLRRHVCFSSSQLPALPPRNWLREKISPKFLEERFSQLRKFMQEVIMLDPYLRCEGLRDFLELEIRLDVTGSHVASRLSRAEPSSSCSRVSKIGSVLGSNVLFLSALSMSKGSEHPPEIRDSHGHISVFLSKSNNLDNIVEAATHVPPHASCQ